MGKRYTLQDLRARKCALKSEIEISKRNMSYSFDRVFSFQKEFSNKIDAAMHYVNIGLSIYEGFMNGRVVARKIRNLFKSSEE